MEHKDIAMTLRYSHLAPRHKQHAVDILSRQMESFWTVEQTTDHVSNADVSDVEMIEVKSDG